MKFNFPEIQKSKHFLLITEFFVYFSRFEYAMKRGGYGLLKGVHQYWDADWNKLSDELMQNQKFSEYLKVIRGSELFCNPPKRMIDKDTFETSSSSRGVIDSIKIVRNNLFHGGKFHGGPNEYESERNIKLIAESLKILKFIIEDTFIFSDSVDLRTYFNESI